MRPGERRPRRPSGALVVSLTAGYRKVMVSDKKGAQIESKLPELFEKADALAAEVHAEHERIAAIQRQEEIEWSRRRELEARVEQLDRNVAAWRRAERIRAYARAVANRRADEGPVTPESDTAKWVAWARSYADSIDPARGPITISPQESWE